MYNVIYVKLINNIKTDEADYTTLEVNYLEFQAIHPSNEDHNYL